MSDKELPQEIKPVFDVLHNDLVALWVRWLTHRKLFQVEKGRIELLNRCAPSFFALLQGVLLDDVLSGIARITDKAETCGRQNATLRQLFRQMQNLEVPESLTTLNEKLSLVEAACEPIRTLRVKRLAHRDYDVAVDSSTYPLPPISYQMIRESLECISDFVNQSQKLYTDTHIEYAETITALGDAASLIHCLRIADNARTEKMRAIESLI